MTNAYGPIGGGTVWELSPANGAWNFSVLYAFPAPTVDDYGPYALTMDTAGNLYGIANWGGPNNYGFLFELTPGNGGWTYTELHDFGPDACSPQGTVVLYSGSLFGAAEGCGTWGLGAVWEFTP